MEITQFKELIKKLEDNHITDDYNIELVAWSNENTGNFKGLPNVLHIELEKDLSFDIGYADKQVNIFCNFI